MGKSYAYRDTILRRIIGIFLEHHVFHNLGKLGHSQGDVTRQILQAPCQDAGTKIICRLYKYSEGLTSKDSIQA